MLGRRSDERFRFAAPAAGAVDVFYDVIVKWSADNEWIAFSREPAFAGETLVLDVDDGEQRSRFTVHVIESSPVIVDGDMRHRLRLRGAASPPAFFEQQVRRG
jgi:hypothetical protein